MRARHARDHGGAVGHARFIRQRQRQRALRQGRVVARRQQVVQLVLDQRRLFLLRPGVQLLPGGGVRMLRHHAQDGAAQRRGHGGGILFAGRIAAARFGDHARFTHVAEDGNQACAQGRHARRFARARFPAGLRHHRRQARHGEAAEGLLARFALRAITGILFVQAAQGAGHLAQHLRVGRQRRRLHQFQEISQVLRTGQAQRLAVRQQAQLIDRRQACKAARQRARVGRCVHGAVVAALARVHQQGAATGHVQGGLAILDQHAGQLAVADRRGDHRHFPRQRFLLRLVLAELRLREGHARAALPAHGVAHRDHRHARLQGEIMGDGADRLAGGRIDFAPQVVGHRIAIRMLAHVAAHGRAPGVGTHVGFEHADHRFALLVGDAVEGLAGLLHGGDALHHGVRGAQRVLAHGRFAPAHAGQGRVPFRVQTLRGAAFHPRRKTFVEPQVVPPAHGDQVAEPLVRHFMRQRGVDVFLVRLGRDGRVEQQAVFEGEDGAPVFHGAEELAAARRGDVVELGQRVAHAEIIVVFAQQGG